MVRTYSDSYTITPVHTSSTKTSTAKSQHQPTPKPNHNNINNISSNNISGSSSSVGVGGGKSGVSGMMTGGSMFFQKLHDYNQNVTFSLPRKVKHPGSIRRFFISGKTRKKEKECVVSCAEEFRPYLEDEAIHEKITDTDIDNLCRLPPGHDKNEWLATHTISFFEHVNLMYGTISEYCTSTGCSAMNGPRHVQYMWFDEKGKKCKCAAPQYVDYVMTFSQKTIQDEAIFPSKYGNAFPSSFESIVKKIHRYLFHVIAHLYQSHFKEITCLKLHGHLNTLFQHFMTFNKHFSLLDERETEPLDDLYRKLEEKVPLITLPPSETSPAGSPTVAGGDITTTANIQQSNIKDSSVNSNNSSSVVTQDGSPTSMHTSAAMPPSTLGTPPTTPTGGNLATTPTSTTTTTTEASGEGGENKENEHKEANVRS